MIITLDLLKQYNACDSTYQYIKENYPDGAEAIVLARDSNISLDDLHFAVKYFDLDENELEEYRRICKIEKSKHVWESSKVYNSEVVFKSNHVDGSKFIFNSENITESTHVFNNSLGISFSSEVVNSINVDNSSLVYESSKISVSNEILRSKRISWSDVILYSSDISDSKFIYQSEELTNCYFCGFCKRCKNCIFCDGIEDEEYMIFNQKVSPKDFSEILEQLLNKITLNEVELVKEEYPQENGLISIVNKNSMRYIERYNISPRYDSVFDNLLPNFYGWVGSLPNYSEDVFINLFFRKLEKK